MKQEKTDSGDPGSDIWYCLQLPATAYETALELQRALVDARIDQKMDANIPDVNIPDVNILLLLEHPPVFTLGRRGGRENLIVPETFLKKSGISIVPVERGGNITYHGPGQLVGYPIINLKNARMDVHTYVSRLEDIMIGTAGDYGVDAGRNSKNRGIWVGNSKMGSIGISIRHGITFHGFALNVNPAMDPFSWINPCGMNDIKMTSIEKELGQSVSMEKAYQSVRRHIETVFDVSVVTLPETSWLQKILSKRDLPHYKKELI